MSIKPILTVPDPILKKISAEVTSFDEGLKDLITDMFDSMYEAKGIGLAAIQIGVPLRVIVMDLVWGKEEAGDKREPKVFINPQIIQKSDETAPYEEGCLSVPDVYEEIERPALVKLKYQNQNGDEIIEDCNELFATCIQHEMDHLNGVVFIDYLSRLKRERAVTKVKKYKKAMA